MPRLPKASSTQVTTGAAGLPLVRKGEAIDYTGAGQDIKFDARGELLGRPSCIRRSVTEKT